MAKGILVVRIEGGLEYPHRILALSIVGPMALPAELIAGLCGQILGHDDLRLIGRLRVLRTRSVAMLTGDIHIFVIPVGDNGFVARKVLCFDRNAGGMTSGTISGEGIVGLRPIFRGFLPERGSANLTFSQHLRISGCAVLHDVNRKEADIILFLPFPGYIVIFHPLCDNRHILDSGQEALLPLTEVGVAVGGFVIGVRVPFTPVALAADRAGNRNPDGVSWAYPNNPDRPRSEKHLLSARDRT